MNVGDLSGVHQTTVGKIIAKVSEAIASLYPHFIRFPTSDEEVLYTQASFFKIAKFPRCVGALDCTHVRIKNPGGTRAETFRNRKGYFSYNVQAVCDANLCFTDIVARWPGSCHDSTIFNNSRIKTMFDRGLKPNQLIVADGGYACNNYTMTPLGNPLLRAERAYNAAQILTRNTIERCFGLYKRRFPVLCKAMSTNLNLCEDVIIATAVLHNIARRNSDEMPELTPEQHRNYLLSIQNIPIDNAQPAQNMVRNNIIFNHFANNLN